MVILLYSDKNCEHQVASCIRSFESKITDSLKIAYFTIGFKSDLSFKNLYKIEVPHSKVYNKFYYYKADLSLAAMRLFPNEDYIFTDTDVIFSRRFNPESMVTSANYAVASYGPWEYPYIYTQSADGRQTIYDETKLMKYMNVSQRSQKYCWSCFYTFNSSSKDFFEEYASVCNNRYLLDRQQDYFPFWDETAFNVCLWKRGANKNLGTAFLNTHLYDSVVAVEEARIKNSRLGNFVDDSGRDWEFVEEPENVILYHGIKNKEDADKILSYMLSK